jgi:light-regulated signal transduction histidine kinase (bacteriophytochrome)
MNALRAYGIAIGLVAAALVLGLAAELAGLQNLEMPLFLMAIAGAIWYAGGVPGVTAIVLAALAFNYFFTEPRYSLYMQPSDAAHFIAFVLFALLIGWFASLRRRVEQDLAKANAALAKRTMELEASNKELEAFAYSTSHDLRAPLRHVAGYAELLQKHAGAVLDEKSRRYVAMLLEAAKRMGTLIDDLLAFSRIGRVETHNTFVPLEPLVRDVIAEVEREADEREIAWKVGALPSVHGDRAMLRLALVNLVSNAVKFTRTRERAEIEIGSAAGGPDEVVVFIRDNGIGFDMKYVDKLFGVFQRLHLQEAFEGTGIGLATVQRILARHGGRVWAEGVVDGGATFYIAAPKA